MKKIEFKDEYKASKKPALLKLGTLSYLSIDGQGEPGGEAFSDRIGALYGAAYTIKMTRKFGGLQDYAIGKLEAQWWAETPNFADSPKERWRWKLMIRTPAFVKKAELKKAVDVLLKRGRSAAVKDARLETLREGRCVQMLHVGPYERERDTIAIMKAFAESQGLALSGRHHEIYLSDPRRVTPEKLKTILRHPVA
jgi:hypothetical protein